MKVIFCFQEKVFTNSYLNTSLPPYIQKLRNGRLSALVLEHKNSKRGFVTSNEIYKGSEEDLKNSILRFKPANFVLFTGDFLKISENNS